MRSLEAESARARCRSEVRPAPPRRRPPLLVVLLAVALLAVSSATAAAGAAEGEADEPLVGVVTRAEVEAAEPDWVAAQVAAEPDREAAVALTEVEPGAEVTVYLGTWCSDSERELARLWRAFDEAAVGFGRELPFAIQYVAVDRDKREPGGRTEGMDLRFVPTFVVQRDGAEVGRMVEVSPHGIEHDLLALLTGEATGVVSARDDLGGDAHPGDGGGEAGNHGSG